MLFKPAINQSSYLKCGIFGFAGAGKSFTASNIAIGLCKNHNIKTTLYLDTETGSDFLLNRFQKEGLELKVCKSRAFIDLLQAIEIAEKEKAVLIIDSITHCWNELLTAYQKQKNITRLTIQHWMPIKQEWRQYTDKFINSGCHIIMCGRAGWEFDYTEDSDGYKELVKTGTKMKAESEMGYEPSLLIEMEKVRNEQGKIGGSFIHRAWVLKDRFDVINSKFFDNPSYESFLPHISLLNIGGEQVGVLPNTSENLFSSDKSLSERFKKRDILLEEIQSEMVLKFGKSDESKKNKINALKKIFGTASWTAIENKYNEELEKGLEKIKKLKEEKNEGKN